MLKPTSSWQDYASSGISGAVSEMLNTVAPGSSKVAKNAIDAVLKPTIKQNLEIASGIRDNIDIASIGKDAAIRFTTSSILKIPGNYTSFPGINSLIGNLPCNMGRGAIKYGRDYIRENNMLPIFS